MWLVNWFAIKGTPNPGLDLLFFPEKNLKFNRIGTIGCNDKATKIFKKLGFEVGELKHYFTINPIISKFINIFSFIIYFLNFYISICIIQ